MTSLLSTPTTYVYKKVDGLELELDVYLPITASHEGNAIPIYVWFHGGGLLMGSRTSAPPHFRRAANKYNICLVSVDYRLAPQAPLKDILEDVRDSITWTREELPAIVKANGGPELDKNRLGVSGSSAGGYLTLLAGLSISGVSPPPKVLLPIYPITNPLGPFFVTPQRPLWYLTDGNIITHEELATHLDLKAAPLGAYPNPGKANVKEGDRWKIYDFMVQEGNLAHLLMANAPPGTKIEDYVPQTWVTKDFPPTLLIHGDTDRYAGVEQSRSMADALSKARAVYHYEELKGIDHSYDYDPEEEMSLVYEWFLKYV